FLLSSALCWLDRYHADGLRVDAVASMLYLDYSRKQGEWIPNKFGGRENLEAVDFLRRFNIEVYKEQGDTQTIAEESTAWPLLSKMPGDDWQKFANLRVLYGWMYAQPGKKLLFMGGEFGQWKEWDVEQSLDWHLLDEPMHGGLRLWVGDLNRILREEKALHEMDFDPAGFAWIDVTDAEQSVVSLMRRGSAPEDILVAVFNFTP